MTTFASRPSRVLGVLASSALLLSLGACAGADTGSASATPTEDDIPSFTFALASPPPSFDKAASTQPVITGSVMSLVTEPLERQSPDGTFVPVLAEKVTQPDTTTIVYTIRSGVSLSDGSPLTAEDVAWSITRTATPPAQTSTSTPAFGSASVTGEREVTVKLKAPLARARLSLSGQVLVQQKKFATANAGKLGTAEAIPIGTGPYTVTSADASGMTLTRRTNYWAQLPKVKVLNVKVIPDDNSAQLAMRSGEVNLRQLNNVKTTPQWRAIPGTTIYSAPSTTVNFLAMDVTKAPFDDVHVRRAIAYATDVPGLINAAWDGEATPLRAFLPVQNLAAVAGGTDTAKAFVDALPDHGFNLDKAKAELAQSGHRDGFSTTIKYVDAAPASKVLALSLQQNLKALGVNVTVESATLNAWSADFFQHKLTGLSLGFGFSTSGNEPSSFLGAAVGAQNVGPQKQNIANFTTPEIEQALPVVNAAGDNATRWAATKTLLSQIAEQVPYVPLASENFVMAIGKGFASATGQVTVNDFFDGRWALNLRATKVSQS